MNCKKKYCSQNKTLLTKYPHKKDELNRYIDSFDLTNNIDKNRGFLIQSLHKAQEIFGYIPKDLQEFIAENISSNTANRMKL